MKENFRYNRITNEWVHDSLPISIDNELFNEMSDDEILSLIDSRIIELNKEINNLQKPKKSKDYLNDEEMAAGFLKAKERILMPESFKQFFMRKDRLNR